MSRTYKKKLSLGGSAESPRGVPSWFKRMNRAEERAKQDQALREGKEIPTFKTRDAYEYW